MTCENCCPPDAPLVELLPANWFEKTSPAREKGESGSAQGRARAEDDNDGRERERTTKRVTALVGTVRVLQQERRESEKAQEEERLLWSERAVDAPSRRRNPPGAC